MSRRGSLGLRPPPPAARSPKPVAKFGYRQSRTDLGRFLAPDPITLVLRVVGAQGVNSYAYVRNNPLRLIDPNGLDARALENQPIQYTDGSPTDFYSQLEKHGDMWYLLSANGCNYSDQDIADMEAAADAGGTGAPSGRFTRDRSGNLVYTDETYGGPFSTCDACLSVSSAYGDPRDDGTTMHTGTDLATGGRKGIDSLSLTDGKVLLVGASGFGPHSVTVVTAKGTLFTYGHLASNYVKAGDLIRAGTRIGEIGNEGVSSGIHLHVQASTIAAFGPTSRMLGVRFP